MERVKFRSSPFNHCPSWMYNQYIICQDILLLPIDHCLWSVFLYASYEVKKKWWEVMCSNTKTTDLYHLYILYIMCVSVSLHIYDKLSEMISNLGQSLDWGSVFCTKKAVFQLIIPYPSLSNPWKPSPGLCNCLKTFCWIACIIITYFRSLVHLMHFQGNRSGPIS